MIVPWRVITNTETNIARENGWLEDDTSFWDGATWQVRTVSSGRTYILGGGFKCFYFHPIWRRFLI